MILPTYTIRPIISASLILILIYNLHTIKKSKIFSISPLNVCDLATFMFDPRLGLEIVTAASPPTSLAISACICIYMITNYFWYCLITCL